MLGRFPYYSYYRLREITLKTKEECFSQATQGQTHNQKQRQRYFESTFISSCCLLLLLFVCLYFVFFIAYGDQRVCGRGVI